MTKPSGFWNDRTGAAPKRSDTDFTLGQDETTFAFESIESFLVALLIEFLLALGDVLAAFTKGSRRNRRQGDRRKNALFGFHARQS